MIQFGDGALIRWGEHLDNGVWLRRESKRWWRFIRHDNGAVFIQTPICTVRFGEPDDG